MDDIRYAGENTLRKIWAKFKASFAAIAHTHKLSDVTDFTIDSELSSTSTNPVQNKTLAAKLNTISTALDGKAKLSHNHHSSEVTYSGVTGNYIESATTLTNVLEMFDEVVYEVETSTNTKVPNSLTINNKRLNQNITLSASDVGAYSKEEIDSYEFITTDDIDAICGSSIVAASGVMF